MIKPRRERIEGGRWRDMFRPFDCEGAVKSRATTNFPEKLDRRFVERPSRFDRIHFIGTPSAASRRLFLKTKEPTLEGEELEAWVRRSEGFSIAYLKEMIIAVKCLNQSLDSVIERLEQMRERKPNSNDAQNSISDFLFSVAL